MMNDQQQKILVVDDDLRLRDLLQRYLSEQGFSVKAVENAAAMDKTLAHERFDLMVLDLMLPGIDGLDVCRSIRQNSATQHIPIIMVTAKGEEAKAEEGMAQVDSADDLERKLTGKGAGE